MIHRTVAAACPITGSRLYSFREPEDGTEYGFVKVIPRCKMRGDGARERTPRAMSIYSGYFFVPENAAAYPAVAVAYRDMVSENIAGGMTSFKDCGLALEFIYNRLGNISHFFIALYFMTYKSLGFRNIGSDNRRYSEQLPEPVCGRFRIRKPVPRSRHQQGIGNYIVKPAGFQYFRNGKCRLPVGEHTDLDRIRPYVVKY